MKLCEMNPYVRFARIQKESLPRVPSAAIDHRVFCCLTGSGKIRIGDRTVPVQKSTFVYIPSGACHFIAEENVPLTWVGCNFDFFRRYGETVAPISSVPMERFRPADILEPTLFSDTDLFAEPIILQDSDLEPMLSGIVRQYAEFSRFSDEICSAQLRELLFEAAKRASLPARAMRCQAEEILVFVRNRYADKLTNRVIADRFSYHPNYISALIREATGVPLHQYLIRYRMHRATILLQSTDLSVAEVGAEVGMPDLKAFSRCYTRETGISPGKLRTESGRGRTDKGSAK